MPSLNKQSKKITIILSVLISFLFVAVITYGATTISANISTDGNLIVNSTVATSTFSTGGLTVGTSQFVVQQTSGNVGIGTTTPGYRLSINASDATTNLFQVATTTNQGIMVINSAGNVGIGTTSPSRRLSVSDDGTYSAYFSGKVGIGTNSPNGPLHVFVPAGGPTGAQIRIEGANVNDYPHLSIKNDAAEWIIFNNGSSNDSLTFNLSGGGNFLNITTAGNVGIGTTTPNRLLQIAGNAGPQLLLTQPGAGTDLKHWYASTTAGSLTFGTLNDALSTLAERLRIDSVGRVGIGTTTPTTMFQVATSTANATTTMEVGKASQNKGSCLKLYDTAGTVAYCSVTGTAFSCSTTSCE